MLLYFPLGLCDGNQEKCFYESLQSLVPLILYVCEDDEEDEEEEEDTFLTADEKKSIYSKAVNLLMSLTLPLECLVCLVKIFFTFHW